MTSPATLPEDRGTLVVHDRAVSTIASAAAKASDGTATQASSGLKKLAGRTLPRVDVHNSGGCVRVDAAIAAQWPQSIDEVAAAARDRIADDVQTMSGQVVQSVDVSVQSISADSVAAVDGSAPALVAGPEPKAAPAASAVGVLGSLAVIGGGVIAIREVLVGSGAVTGSRWLPSAVDWIDGLEPQAWMVPAGIGAAVLGLVLMLLAVKPRRSTHRSLLADGVYLRRKDLAALLETTVGRVDGVGTGRVVTSKRRATVSVTALPGADTAAVRRGATDAVAREVAILSEVPKVKVKVASAVAS